MLYRCVKSYGNPMASKKRPKTIVEYIDAAPPEGKEHLEQLYKALKIIAPKADEAIKWGTPFFFEPRFLHGYPEGAVKQAAAADDHSSDSARSGQAPACPQRQQLLVAKGSRSGLC